MENSGGSMKLYLFFALILATLSCKPEVERSQLPALETFFGVFQSATDTSVLTLSYSPSTFTFTQNTQITPITPSIIGTITNCSASPNLPAGLSLNPITCIITGTPTVSQVLTDYIITASNKNQSSVVTISIAVNASAPTPTLPTVSFGSTSASGLETVNTISVPVTISTAADSTVNYSVTGTATSGIDFTLASGTLTFTSAGTTTQNISFLVIDDNLNELDETIVISLSAGNNSAIGANATYTYTILDEDPLPTINFTAATQSVTESIGTATITVQLSATSGKLITIPFAVNVSSTATGGGGDYTLPASPLVIPPGGTSTSISIAITDDANFETNETVVIDLGTPINANAGANIVHTLTITDNDPPPTIAFTATASTNSESISTFTIPVSLSASSSQSISVDYSVTGGTATSGADYTLTSGTLTFASGIITQSITLSVNNDLKDELDETIILTLSNPNNTSLGTNTTHTYTIIDDDLPPTVSFTSASQSLSENGGTITVTAQLSATSDLAVTVPFTVNAASNATGGGTDYSITASPLTITAGSTTATITINLINDSIDEPDEIVIIDIGTPTNATASGTISHTATITDDDPPPTIQFTAISQSVAENAGAILVTAQLSAISEFNVTVPITVNASSTNGGSEYTLSATPLTIAAGSLSSNLTVTIINDAVDEADETIILDIGSPTNATGSGNITHTITVTDDDPPPSIAFNLATSANSESITSVTIPVSLSLVSGQIVTVDYAVTGGTATGAGTDFTLSNGTLTFPKGVATQNISLTVVNDSFSETNESIIITLSNPTNSTLGSNTTHTYTITDNDIGITSAETLDCSGNGKIDHYKLTFTSALTDSSFPGYALNGIGTATSDWLIAGYTGVTLDHGTSVNTACSVTDTADDSIIYLKFDEGSGFDTGVKPDLTTTATPIASGAVGNVAPIFTATVNEADTAKPVVTSVTPVNGATSVLLTTNADVTFSEDMNTGTFNSTNFYLTGAASVLGSVSTLSATSSRFDPTLLLAAFQSHTVTVSGMTDVNGNTIVAFSSTFTTSPLNKVVGTVSSSAALPTGLTISNGTSSVNVTSGATSTAYQTAADLGSGTNYTISITSQPPGQICSLIDTGNLSGTAGTSDITVNVNCVNGYSVGGGGIQIVALTSNPFHLQQGNVTLISGATTTGSTDANGTSARYNTPIGITSDGQNLYIADNLNNKIRKIDASGNVTTIAGNGTAGNTPGSGAIASLVKPRSIATDGTYLYVAEYGSAAPSGGNRIKRIRLSDNYVETLAGDDTVVSPAGASLDGTGTAARFNEPSGIAIENNILYITERSANKVRKLDLSTKAVTTLTTGGQLNTPEGIVIIGGFLYVSCINWHKIVRIDKSTGAQTLFAGNASNATGFVDAVGSAAYFSYPHGLTTDGTNLFLVDQGNRAIRQINIATQRVSTLAGNGINSVVDGTGIGASFSAPAHIFTNGKEFYVSDAHGIRRVTNNALVTYYPLQNTLMDYAGNANLTVNGSPTQTTGRFNEANGASNFVTGSSLSNGTSPTSNTTNVSLAAWVKWNGVDIGDNQVILAVGGLSNGYLLVLRRSIGNKLTILQQSSAWGVNCQFTLPINLWTHIAATSSSAGQWKMYINGKHICSEALAAPIAPSGNISVGGLPGSQSFSGAVTDARVYTRVLNESEINELAQNASSALVGASYSTGATGLLVNFHMDNGSGNSSGPITDLGLTGTTGTSVNGKEGDAVGARYFNGSSHFLSTNTPYGMPRASGPRTLCAWIQPSQATSNVVVGYGNNVAGQGMGISLYLDKYFFWTYGGAGLTSTSNVILNKWQHYCGVYDPINGAKIYVDGAELASTTAAGFGTVNTTLSALTIGRNNIDSNNFFAGKIDDVSIYNNALSAIQIRQLAAQVPMGLVARYDFQGDTKDVSGFGIDASSFGTVNSDVDRFGRSASSYSFAGTFGNFLRAADTNLPKGANPRTACMWYRSVSGDFAVPFAYGVTGSRTAIWLQAQSIARFWTEGTDLDTNVNIPHSIWRHVCIVYNGTNSMVYVNGRLIDSQPRAVNTGSDGFIYIGSWLNTREYGGSIDDVRVYNRALSTNEISALTGYHAWQVPSWNPSYGSSSLKFHLQADSLSSLANNATVASWVDTANTLSGTSSGSPTFLTTGINNRPAVQFNSALFQYFNFTGSASQSTTSSLFTVFQKENAGSSGSFLSNMGTTGLYEVYFDTTNRFIYSKNGVGSLLQSNAAINDNTKPYLISFHHNQPGNTGGIYSAETSIFESGTFNNPPAATPTNFNIGAPFCLCGTSYFQGKIAEFLYFHQELNASDRLLVNCYLSAKYNIPLATSAVCP